MIKILFCLNMLCIRTILTNKSNPQQDWITNSLSALAIRGKYSWHAILSTACTSRQGLGLHVKENYNTGGIRWHHKKVHWLLIYIARMLTLTLFFCCWLFVCLFVWESPQKKKKKKKSSRNIFCWFYRTGRIQGLLVFLHPSRGKYLHTNLLL